MPARLPMMLLPNELTVAALISGPSLELLLDRILLPAWNVPPVILMAPPVFAVFPVRVLLATVRLPEALIAPPALPPPFAVFWVNVLLLTVAVPALLMAPPLARAVLLKKVLL
jgi:hypothetical protein